MELKYYLRGLGLGIVVTAIIMGIISSGSSEMTNDEIIARAKQLGMTESRVLSDTASGEEKDLESVKEEDSIQPEGVSDESAPQENNDAVNGPEENNAINEPAGKETVNGPEGAGTAAEDVPDAVLPDDEETGQEAPPDTPVMQDTAEMQESPEENAEPEQRPKASDTPMVITVGGGDGSYTVSMKLEDVGAVASASEFDTFLCENGYDKRIRAGSYAIPADAGDEQIARMITGLE
ncbi:MAG: hypothetical protein NC341_06815 [Blautia sp.]|nr:hypothetical protein [Blautia sp.]MCM1201198.1 hypothetical protein [Bacteroides fragilis]